MTSSINTKIDVSLLKEQLGIEVIDNGDGNLSAGDRLVFRTESEFYTHEVNSFDLQSPQNITAMLNNVTRGMEIYTENKKKTEHLLKIGFVYDESKSKSYLVSVGNKFLAASEMMRVYEISDTNDRALVTDGDPVAYKRPESKERTGINAAFNNSSITTSLGQNSQPSVAYDVRTSVCDKLSSDPEKLACYKKVQADHDRMERELTIDAKIKAAKDVIREHTLNGTLTAADLTMLTDLLSING